MRNFQSVLMLVAALVAVWLGRLETMTLEG